MIQTLPRRVQFFTLPRVIKVVALDASCNQSCCLRLGDYFSDRRASGYMVVRSKSGYVMICCREGSVMSSSRQESLLIYINLED